MILQGLHIMTFRSCFITLTLSAGMAFGQGTEIDASQKDVEALEVGGFKNSILKAVNSHPQILKLQKASKVAWYDVDIADGGFFPTVDFRSSNGQDYNQNETVENDNDNHRDLFRRENSLIVRQLLYDGGENSRRVEKNEALYNRANFSTLDSKEALALRAIVSYLDVLRVKEQMELSKGNIKAHKDILDLVEKKGRNAAKSEKIQVEGRLALAEAQLRRDNADLNSAMGRFKELFGKFPSKLVQPDEVSGIPKDLKEAQNSTAVSHPSVLASRETIKGVVASVEEVKTRYKPRVHLELSGAKNENLSGSRSNEESASAMVVFTYNFYNGGRDSSTIERELTRKDQEEQQLYEIQRSLVRDVSSAWYERDGKVEELIFFKAHLKASSETYDAYLKQYDLGKRTLFDLLNARSEYFRARFSVVDANYTIMSSEFRILATMGKLMSYLSK